MYQGVTDGIASFETHFNPMFSTHVLAAFTQALHIWDHYVGPFAVCVGHVLGGPLFAFILIDIDSV